MTIKLNPLAWNELLGSLHHPISRHLILRSITPQMHWQLDAEAFLKQLHVADVFLNGHVPMRVTEHLHSRRQAADVHASDKPSSTEPLSRIDPI
ncbi:MAG: hypothetical protein M3362_25445, partial [Acidobacteriota bacterium]|nr:hypothetical protein [Acidobacteriota bacterium]